MFTIAQARTAITARSIVDHNARAGWEIDDTAHALGMMLADLIVFASVYGVDFDTELASAREVVEEVYDAADMAPIDNPALPSNDALALAARYAAAAYAALPSNDARISDETRAMANHLDCRLAAAVDAEG